jgi:hypothetical protein
MGFVDANGQLRHLAGNDIGLGWLIHAHGDIDVPAQQVLGPVGGTSSIWISGSNWYNSARMPGST